MERRTEEKKIEPEDKGVPMMKGSGRRTKNDREQESKPGISRKSSNATLSESETGTAFGLSSGNGRSESPRSSRRSPRAKQDIAGLREIYTLEFKKVVRSPKLFPSEKLILLHWYPHLPSKRFITNPHLFTYT